MMSKLPFPTPHIKATPSDIAETVLMPGDPLRAQFIANTFLEDAVLFNNVRGIQGYTGIYHGSRVSVMASGMGMPSIGIYSYELYTAFDVQNIIRVGSAGGMQPNIKLRDIVLGMGACTDSAYGNQFHLSGTFAPIASYSLLKAAADVAKEMGIDPYCGNVLSSDVFYNADPDASRRWASLGVLCVEMESAALYMNAARCGKNALSILTISDHLFTGEATTADERQTSFTQMLELALETAVRLS